ncbi:MAG: VOC family protein [Gemmatimonadota bacterium]|jgi:catechol 2,3-dioxygenase
MALRVVMLQNPTVMATPSLPPDTRIGSVHLRVADLERQVAFYRDALGFTLLAEDGATAALGSSSDRPLVVLHEAPGAPPAPQGAPGLFHMALLLPDRLALSGMIRRVRSHGATFDGFADHNVSEAAYLRDPEGNGIELYADRVRSVWRTVEGRIFMTTEPLDLPGLLAATTEPAPALPGETVMGHIHLRVSSLAAAEAFYVDRLGFDVVTRDYPGALFVAAGDYHHHVGLNVWGSRAGAPAPEGARGLVSFDVVVPPVSARRTLLGGDDEGTLSDADQHTVRIRAPGASGGPTPRGGG